LETTLAAGLGAGFLAAGLALLLVLFGLGAGFLAGAFFLAGAAFLTALAAGLFAGAFLARAGFLAGAFLAEAEGFTDFPEGFRDGEGLDFFFNGAQVKPKSRARKDR
jgi:hypothetical protein